MHTRARAVTCRLRVPLHPRECAHDHPPLRHPLDGAAGGAPPPYRPQSDHGPSGMWGWRGHRPYSGTTAVSLPLATGLRHSTLHGSLRYTTQAGCESAVRVEDVLGAGRHRNGFLMVAYSVSGSRTSCSNQQRVGFSRAPCCLRAVDTVSAARTASMNDGGRSGPSRDDLVTAWRAHASPTRKVGARAVNAHAAV